MSAPALHPTARLRPVLRERVERQRLAHYFAAFGMVALAVYLRVNSVQVTWSAAVACVLLCGGFLPGLQAIDPGDRVWDATLPMDTAGYARIRLACGVAGAAFLLAFSVALYAALFGEPGEPGWYPLALFSWGLTAHLMVSSVLLLTAGAPIGLLVVVVLCPLALVLLPVSLADPAKLGQMGVTAVLDRTALLLGLAAAVAYAATRFPARPSERGGGAAGPTRAYAPAGLADRHARAPRQDPVTLPDRPAPAAVLPRPRLIRRGVPTRPSAMLTVFRRHLALLLRFTIVPALTLFVFAWMVLIEALAGPSQEGESLTVSYFVESLALRYVCAFIALSWTVLVWLGERGPQRRWNDTLPVGTAKRRILHLAAGSAWLLIILAVAAAVPVGGAAVAGAPTDVPAWLWLELSIATLTLYLAATFVIFGLCVAWNTFFLLVFFLVSPGVGLLGSRARMVAEGTGSNAAALLWLVLFAAAAAGAVVLEDWISQHGRLPTVREVRGFIKRKPGLTQS